jgi:hypothetical protein
MLHCGSTLTPPPPLRLPAISLCDPPPPISLRHPRPHSSDLDGDGGVGPDKTLAVIFYHLKPHAVALLHLLCSRRPTSRSASSLCDAVFDHLKPHTVALLHLLCSRCLASSSASSLREMALEVVPRARP